jgi:predicted lipoprotein with Yx(FWY)xxD motif
MGYSDTSPDQATIDAEVRPPVTIEAPVPTDAGALLESEDARGAESELDAPDGDSEAPVQPRANLRLGHTVEFDGYLMDGAERPLYMFAEDVAGSPSSACLDACAKEWPPFDLLEVEPEPGILENEVTRFHRQDGRWQSAYKGHPLYYRASELGSRDVTGDAHDGRWFVARDYLAFISFTMSFAPAGSDSFDAGFLTNGFGRALYVCFDDAPGDADTAPVSSCVGDCARRRPLWSVSEAARTSILPSVMNASDISTFTRPDGVLQLALRGWPIYYFSGDEDVGDVQGQNQNAWRAIDPVNFGKQVALRIAGIAGIAGAPQTRGGASSSAASAP